MEIQNCDTSFSFLLGLVEESITGHHVMVQETPHQCVHPFRCRFPLNTLYIVQNLFINKSAVKALIRLRKCVRWIGSSMFKYI